MSNGKKQTKFHCGISQRLGNEQMSLDVGMRSLVKNLADPLQTNNLPNLGSRIKVYSPEKFNGDQGVVPY